MTSFVTVELTITEAACVRQARLIQQSPLSDLNRSALFAVSQWLFEPGRLNGMAVLTVFNITINYVTN